MLLFLSTKCSRSVDRLHGQHERSPSGRGIRCMRLDLQTKFGVSKRTSMIFLIPSPLSSRVMILDCIH